MKSKALTLSALRENQNSERRSTYVKHRRNDVTHVLVNEFVHVRSKRSVNRHV